MVLTWSSPNSSLLFGAFIISQISDITYLDHTNKLPNYIRPDFYNIHLNLSTIEEGYFYGTCEILIKLNHPTNNITFHAQWSRIIITQVTIYINNSRFEQELRPHTFNTEHSLYTIYFNHELNNGAYLLEIAFKNNLCGEEDEKKCKLFFENKKGIGIWLFATLENDFQIGARRIFPCWDEPHFEANFAIDVTYQNKYKASSNMPVRNEISKRSDSLTSTYFKATPRISPYHIAFVLSTFAYTPDGEVTFQCRKQAEPYLNAAMKIIDNVTQYLERRLKCFRKLAEVVHVVTPDFHRESMNNLRFVFYREPDLIYDEKLDLIAHKTDMAQLIGRAIVHQCTYDPSNPNLSHLTLRKAINILFVADAIHKIYPNFRTLDLFVVQIQQESLRLDIPSIMNPFVLKNNNKRINSEFYYYLKVPALLRMLQHKMKDVIFWEGIETFLFQEKYKNSVDFDDLWVTMQYFLDKLKNDTFDIKSMMNPWTKLFNYPILKLVQHHPLRVDVILENPLNQTMMQIPITITTQDNSNFTNMYPSHHVLINCNYIRTIFCNEELHFLSSTGWMMINTQQTGYYRVNYGDMFWDRIIHYLNTSNEYIKIHVLNRAQLIDDAYSLLMDDLISLSIFLNLTKYLQRETDYIAWYPMIKALEHMSGFFLLEESASMKEHMQKILHKLLKIITYTEKLNEKNDDFIKCLRQEAAKWACFFGNSDCITAATLKLTQHLAFKERLLPGWNKWTYCNGVMNNSSVWWQVFDTWVNKSDSKLLEYLPCTQSPNIIFNYLSIIANKSKSYHSNMSDIWNVKMQPNDRANSYLITVARHAKNDEILEYILRNFMKIKPSEVSVRVALINIINNVQSKNQLDKILEMLIYKRHHFQASYLSHTYELHIHVNYNYITFEKIIEAINTSQKPDKTISFVKQKIEKRQSEISTQRMYFQNLIKK